MAEEISFVEVLMTQWQPGDREYQDYLENEVQLFDVPWEDATEEIPEAVKALEENERKRTQAEVDGKQAYTCMSLGFEPDTLVIQPLTGFSFRFFGQGFSPDWANGIEFEASEGMGIAATFEGWQDELKKLGRSVIEDKKAQGLDFKKLYDGKYVRFVTLWSYRSWQDSYSGEFDSEWDLLGLINLGLVKESCIEREVKY